MPPTDNAQPDSTNAWNSKPLLHGFITKRKESFGGYLYNPYLLKPVSFNRPEMQIIDMFDGENSLADIYQSCLQSMKRRKQVEGMMTDTFEKLRAIFAVHLKEADETSSLGRSSNSRVQIQLPDKLPDSDHLTAPLSVLWDITYACNLNCRHCLSGSGKSHTDELTTQEAKKVIDMLADLKVFTITFCGGEPLLRKDLIPLMHHASNRNMGLKISTNGTLVTEKLIKQLDDVNLFAVQVSLDGRASTHDRLRRRPGAYNRAIRAIKHFVAAGYYTVVAPVVTRQNRNEMDELIDTAAALGASAFKPSLFMPAGRGERHLDELYLPKNEVRSVMSELSRKQKQFQGQLHIHLEAKYPESDEGACETHGPPMCSQEMVAGCSAGNTQVVLTANGDVVPCPFLYQFVAGNLRHRTLDTIWHNAPALHKFRTIKQADLKGKCRQCGHIPNRCLGGCRAAAYLYSGDLYAEDPLCWLTQN